MIYNIVVGYKCGISFGVVGCEGDILCWGQLSGGCDVMCLVVRLEYMLSLVVRYDIGMT